MKNEVKAGQVIRHIVKLRVILGTRWFLYLEKKCQIRQEVCTIPALTHYRNVPSCCSEPVD